MAKRTTKKTTEATVGPFNKPATLCRGVAWDKLCASITAEAQRAIKRAQEGGRLLDPSGFRVTIAEGRVPGTGHRPGDVWVIVDAATTTGAGFNAERAELMKQIEKLTDRAKHAEAGTVSARAEAEGLRAMVETHRTDADRYASRCADLEIEVRLLREAAMETQI